MPRYVLTQKDRRKGGLSRVYAPNGEYRPDFIKMCEKGWERCLELHPEYALWLKKNIIRENKVKNRPKKIGTGR